jgi:SAM-dependent methyltransferase
VNQDRCPHLPSSPAAERNKQPILERLRTLLPASGAALEIASGTGQHAVWFAGGLPDWSWQPTDFEADALSAIAARVADARLGNVHRPLQLDVLSPQWPAAGAEFSHAFDVIFCANMLHISPWTTCAALMQGAARQLTPDGVLITYGPYLESDVPTSPGNLTFNASLQASNPAWGIRHLDDVRYQALAAGLHLQQRHTMPANNLLLVWRREPDAAAQTPPM